MFATTSPLITMSTSEVPEMLLFVCWCRCLGMLRFSFTSMVPTCKMCWGFVANSVVVLLERFDKIWASKTPFSSISSIFNFKS